MQACLTREEIKNIDHIDAKMRETLKESRYRHTVSVSNTAACLSFIYDVDLYETLISGRLHDCAKRYTDEELLTKCEEKKITISEVERLNPSLLHAKLGAYMAEHRYGITNENVLSAIRYHTTGRPGMSNLEKIIFVADYIEPFRYHAPNLSELRQTAFKDINTALIMILKQTLDYLKYNDFLIDEMTQKTYDYYTS
ncbi:MAG: bis(5'-nucleosyl)-tetraphosphatase (symmetrical) YqeK [Lachnospiraceae bacterium]|nr:bis(5'-nucleosyl)-tetraphosphatase (symmetrical) YqeK [Lachnospiraceae bacterium]